jgi:short-subunit dehydrogenase
MNVFLTGGSSGIGKQFKQHLESNNYAVTAPSRQELDLANLDIDIVDFKSYDYLVLCAGVDTNGRAPFAAMKSADFVNTVTVNLTSNIILIHKYVQQRMFKPWSKVIVLGSQVVDGYHPGYGVYGTSKHGLDAFMSTISYELRDKNIGFTIMHPGLTKTNFNRNRGNVPEDKVNDLYDQTSHMQTEDLIPVFDQILHDQKNLITKISLTR